MTSSNDKNKKAEKKHQDFDELEDILGKITESDDRPATSPKENKSQNNEIYQKPTGIEDQPEDLEGMLDKITEMPEVNVDKLSFEPVEDFKDAVVDEVEKITIPADFETTPPKLSLWQRIVRFFTGR